MGAIAGKPEQIASAADNAKVIELNETDDEEELLEPVTCSCGRVRLKGVTCCSLQVEPDPETGGDIVKSTIMDATDDVSSMLNDPFCRLFMDSSCEVSDTLPANWWQKGDDDSSDSDSGAELPESSSTSLVSNDDVPPADDPEANRAFKTVTIDTGNVIYRRQSYTVSTAKPAAKDEESATSV